MKVRTQRRALERRNMRTARKLDAEIRRQTERLRTDPQFRAQLHIPDTATDEDLEVVAVALAMDSVSPHQGNVSTARKYGVQDIPPMQIITQAHKL